MPSHDAGADADEAMQTSGSLNKLKISINKGIKPRETYVYVPVYILKYCEGSGLFPTA